MKRSNLLQNRKFLIAIGLLAVVLIVFLIFLGAKNSGLAALFTPAEEEEFIVPETDSSAAEADIMADEAYLAANHPIAEFLPYENYTEPRFYVGFDLSQDKKGEYSFSLVVGYGNEAGKQAAEAYLGSAKMRSLGSANYQITYEVLERLK